MTRRKRLLIAAAVLLCIAGAVLLYQRHEAREEQAYLLAAIEHIMSDGGLHFQVNLEERYGSYETTISYHLPECVPGIQQEVAAIGELLYRFAEEGSLVVDREHWSYHDLTFIEFFATDESYLSVSPGYTHVFLVSNASGFGAHCRLEWKAALLLEEKIQAIRGYLGLR